METYKLPKPFTAVGASHFLQVLITEGIVIVTVDKIQGVLIYLSQGQDFQWYLFVVCTCSYLLFCSQTLFFEAHIPVS